MRGERVGQHRGDAEQGYAGHGVADLVVLRRDGRCGGDDGRAAANARANGHQCAEPFGQTDTFAHESHDQQRGADRADDDRQALQADGPGLDDAEPDAQQYDAQPKNPDDRELDARPQRLGQLEDIVDENAEQDRHHDGTDRALLQTERRRCDVSEVLTRQRQEQCEQKTPDNVHRAILGCRDTPPEAAGGGLRSLIHGTGSASPRTPSLTSALPAVSEFQFVLLHRQRYVL